MLTGAARQTIKTASRWQLPPQIRVSLLLTDDEEIWQLNRSFRGVDKPTDVLSFPLWEEQPIWQPETQEALELGDITISLETATRQAAEYGHSVERETVFLFVHGLLHLLGYDHEQGILQEKRMFALQEQIMRAIGLPR